MKVERSLSVSTRGRSVPPAQDLGTFLKRYMLGLISHINDMLQDVQGKKSTSYKRQILCSLGAMVVRVGSAISNVAPQVHATSMLRISELIACPTDNGHVANNGQRAPAC
jgi:serine/threonine-protein kinase ATR